MERPLNTETCADDPKGLRDEEVLDVLRALTLRSHATLADILRYLGEVEERKLYFARGHTSLFGFCIRDLHLSEHAAEHRITVARAARRFPQMLPFLRDGRIHLSGLRLLVPHLTETSCDSLLARATYKTKREIEELVAEHAPRGPVPDSIRKLPEPRKPAGSPAAPVADADSRGDGVTQPPFRQRVRAAVVSPLAPDRYRIELTAPGAFRDKVKVAQALLRHEIPSGDLASIFDRALTLLIAAEEKRIWGVGRRARPAKSRLPGPAKSRHVPDELRRAVYLRDGGCCTYVDAKGKRCGERDFLQIDHVDGFGRTNEHSLERMRLLCAGHNRLTAELMYGREFIAEKVKQARRAPRARKRE